MVAPDSASTRPFRPTGCQPVGPWFESGPGSQVFHPALAFPPDIENRCTIQSMNRRTRGESCRLRG